MITHSFIVAAVESYTVASRQMRWMSRILPSNWEMIFVDDGSDPPIPIPDELPENFRLFLTGEVRAPGEWTQKRAINRAVGMARGAYILKSDVDHVFTREAIVAADRFTGDLMLFNRRAGVLTKELHIEPINQDVLECVDDIYLVRKSLFMELGGYPDKPENQTRHYGGGGSFLWEYSKAPEAVAPREAQIYVIPDTHERFHSLSRIRLCELPVEERA